MYVHKGWVVRTVEASLLPLLSNMTFFAACCSARKIDGSSSSSIGGRRKKKDERKEAFSTSGGASHHRRSILQCCQINSILCHGCLYAVNPTTAFGPSSRNSTGGDGCRSAKSHPPPLSNSRVLNEFFRRVIAAAAAARVALTGNRGRGGGGMSICLYCCLRLLANGKINHPYTRHAPKFSAGKIYIPVLMFCFLSFPFSSCKVRPHVQEAARESRGRGSIPQGVQPPARRRGRVLFRSFRHGGLGDGAWGARHREQEPQRELRVVAGHHRDRVRPAAAIVDGPHVSLKFQLILCHVCIGKTLKFPPDSRTAASTPPTATPSPASPLRRLPPPRGRLVTAPTTAAPGPTPLATTAATATVLAAAPTATGPESGPRPATTTTWTPPPAPSSPSPSLEEGGRSGQEGEGAPTTAGERAEKRRREAEQEEGPEAEAEAEGSNRPQSALAQVS